MWNPCTKKIRRIESIEYLVRLRKLRLLSLENRRFIADVVFFYKLINDHIHLALDSRVCFSRDVDR